MIARYDLSGVWELSLAQMAGKQVPAAFDDTISLPGTTSLAKKGTPNPARETGFLTDAYAFEGQAWFRKTVYLDPDFLGLPMKLTLERTRITTLWINGRRVGSCDSLCTPHVYEISAYVAKPLVEIVVCVENTGYPTKGGHLTSPDTQSNWNGITGSMTLEVFSEVYADHVQAYPDPERREVTLTMQLHGAKTASFAAEGSVMEDDEEDSIPTFQTQLTADASGMASVTIPLEEAYYEWSEFHPVLYCLTYRINEQDCGYLSFGMRQFCTDGMRFTINGQPTMLRGKHDGLIFPRTGYAPTEVNEWIRILEIAKSYGINHYRFHTCCPPDAAFTAADLLGIYMEPELRSGARSLRREKRAITRRNRITSLHWGTRYWRHSATIPRSSCSRWAMNCGGVRSVWERFCGITRRWTAVICTHRAATISSASRRFCRRTTISWACA